MANATVSCPSCSKPTAGDSALCVHCGVAIQTSAPSPDHYPPPPPLGQPGTAGTQGFVLGEHPDSLTQRGFLASLLDVSFTSMLGTKLIRVIYVLAMVWVGLTALLYVLLAFHLSPGLGLIVLLVVAPVSSLFVLGLTRAVLELCIGIFQIVANSNELVAQGRRTESR